MIRLRPNFRSITTRLILFGLTLLLIGAVGRTLLLSHYLRGDLLKQSSFQLTTLADYAAQDIARNLQTRSALLQQLAVRIPESLIARPAELHDWLAERLAINPIFSRGLVVLSPSGTPIVDVSLMPRTLPIPWPDAGFRKGTSLSAVRIGTPFVEPFSDKPLLPMTVPLLDANGRLQAYLVGLSTLDDSGFLQTLRTTHIGNSGGLLLISPADRVFLGASYAGMTLTSLPSAGSESVLARALTGFRGTATEISPKGVEELESVVAVPGSDWVLIARLPTDEVYQPLTKLRLFILHNTSILTLIFFSIVIIGLRYLLGPLRHAAQHADRMTHGEIPLAPLPTVRNDEVGHLTEAFNRVLSKLLESQAELQHLAHRDPLTGLPNRHLLADRMNQALARAKRNNTQVAVLFLDLDRFKPINDTLGHDAGDIALQEVSSRLYCLLRQVDTLARVGGDEFVILLTDLGEDARFAAETVAKKCLEAFEHEFYINGEICRLGASIGIAMSRGDHPPDKLLTYADQAMYQSKLAGQGQISWSD